MPEEAECFPFFQKRRFPFNASLIMGGQFVNGVPKGNTKVGSFGFRDLPDGAFDGLPQ